jgi:hypothetical protein
MAVLARTPPILVESLLFPYTAGAPPHDWLCLTGGAIGQGLPAYEAEGRSYLTIAIAIAASLAAGRTASTSINRKTA